MKMSSKIFKENDGYWFYDENQDDYEGPFGDYHEAEIAYFANAKAYSRDRGNSLRKMRVWDD